MKLSSAAIIAALQEDHPFEKRKPSKGQPPAVPSGPRQNPGEFHDSEFKVIVPGENKIVQSFDSAEEAIDWAKKHDHASKNGFMVVPDDGTWAFGTDNAEAYFNNKHAAYFGANVIDPEDMLDYPPDHPRGDQKSFAESGLALKKKLSKAKTYLNPKVAADQAALEQKGPKAKIKEGKQSDWFKEFKKKKKAEKAEAKKKETPEASPDSDCHCGPTDMGY